MMEKLVKAVSANANESNEMKFKTKKKRERGKILVRAWEFRQHSQTGCFMPHCRFCCVLFVPFSFCFSEFMAAEKNANANFNLWANEWVDEWQGEFFYDNLKLQRKRARQSSSRTHILRRNKVMKWKKIFEIVQLVVGLKCRSAANGIKKNESVSWRERGIEKWTKRDIRMYTENDIDGERRSYCWWWWGWWWKAAEKEREKKTKHKQQKSFRTTQMSHTQHECTHAHIYIFYLRQMNQCVCVCVRSAKRHVYLLFAKWNCSKWLDHPES